MREGICQKIMVATDGSELSYKAVKAGIEIARLSGAKIYAIYVLAPEAYSERDFAWEKAAMENFRADGEKATGIVEEAAKTSNVEVESIILEGNPAQEIVKFAEQNGMEMIVMGTLGRTGIDRFLLGSVAEKVVRHSKIPVMVVRGEAAK